MNTETKQQPMMVIEKRGSELGHLRNDHYVIIDGNGNFFAKTYSFVDAQLLASAPDMAKEIAQLKADKAELVEGLKNTQNIIERAYMWATDQGETPPNRLLGALKELEKAGDLQARNLIAKHSKV